MFPTTMISAVVANFGFPGRITKCKISARDFAEILATTAHHSKLIPVKLVLMLPLSRLKLVDSLFNSKIEIR